MSLATLDIAKAQEQFAELDQRLVGEKVLWITRRDKKAFAIVDTELMEAVLEALDILGDPDALRMLQASQEDVRDGKLIDHEAVKKALL